MGLRSDMSVDVDKFLGHLTSKHGKLERWERDIFKLHRAQISYQGIAEYLNANGVKASKMEVYRFIHRKKRAHLRGDCAANQPADISKVAHLPHRTAPGDAPDGESPQPGTDLPKFSWRQSRAKDEPKW